MPKMMMLMKSMSQELTPAERCTEGKTVDAEDVSGGGYEEKMSITKCSQFCSGEQLISTTRLQRCCRWKNTLESNVDDGACSASVTEQKVVPVVELTVEKTTPQVWIP